MEFDGYLPGVEAYRNSAERFANYAVAGVGEGLPAIPELAARGRRRLDIFFDRLENRLAESAFVAGDSFTMADITGVVAVDMAKRSNKELSEGHVHARRWYQSMYARESIASTYLD